MMEKRQVKAKKGAKASKKTAKKSQVAQAKGASRAVQVQVQINQNRKTTMSNTRKRQQALENLNAPRPPPPNPLQMVPIPFPQPQPVMTPQGVAQPDREQALLQVMRGLTNSLQSSNIQVGTSNLNLNPTTRTQLDNLPVNIGVQASPSAMTQAIQVGVPTGLRRGIEIQTDLNNADSPTNNDFVKVLKIENYGTSRNLNASLPTGAVSSSSSATITERNVGRSLPVAGRDQQSIRINPEGAVSPPNQEVARMPGTGAVVQPPPPPVPMPQTPRTRQSRAQVAEEMERVLAYRRNNPMITQAQISRDLGISPTKVSRYLRR